MAHSHAAQFNYSSLFIRLSYPVELLPVYGYLKVDPSAWTRSGALSG
jgi:hypothetical protein